MPELPEVETVRREIDRQFLRRPIRLVRLGEDPQLRRPIPGDLPGHLQGHAFDRTHRHGKFLFVKVAGSGWLVLHLGMTGQILSGSTQDPEPPHARFIVAFADGGRMILADPRKFGEVTWTEEPAAFMQSRGYGADALDPALDARRFAGLFAGRRALVKPALLNQSLVAGLGNLYVDEILFQTRLSPRARFVDLSEDKIMEMFVVMRRILRRSIAVKTDFSRLPPDYLLSRRQGDRVCPACERALEKTAVGGRSTWYCPFHQTPGHGAF